MGLLQFFSRLTEDEEFRAEHEIALVDSCPQPSPSFTADTNSSTTVPPDAFEAI